MEVGVEVQQVRQTPPPRQQVLPQVHQEQRLDPNSHLLTGPTHVNLCQMIPRQGARAEGDEGRVLICRVVLKAVFQFMTWRLLTTCLHSHDLRPRVVNTKTIECLFGRSACTLFLKDWVSDSVA
jgi:hypothetical protein